MSTVTEQILFDNHVKIAKPEDAQRILGFYHSFIGTDGCTWNEKYPGITELTVDIEKKNLFYMEDAKGIIATISIDSDRLVDALALWSIKNAGEAARLGVRQDMQNRGIARKMLMILMQILKERGYEGIHFLVSPDNQAALASYSRLGFVPAGKAYLYEHEWLCYEKHL